MANSKRKCKNCGERVRNYIVVNNVAYCNFEALVQYGIKSKDKGAKIKRKASDKAHRARKKVFKDNDKSLRTKAAQQAFNAFIRKRDESLPCISCLEFREETAKHKGSNFHAGHYKSVGAKAELRFEELNCHKQCAYCNNFLSGNMENYRLNLINKIGLDKVEWIDGPHEPKKYTCAELKEIELHYKAKIKELESIN
jgi:hypothetical protein